jgi:ribosomal protein S18 acetylase RimI-like enzyme
VTVDLRPLDSAALAAWLADQSAGYIEELIASGLSPSEAEDSAARTLGRLFPDGQPVAGQIVGALVDDGRPVGTLWVGPMGKDPQRWWVWDIAIDVDHRGRGLGRAGMLVAEARARAGGATSIGLNVFGHNAVARSLYSSLGYEESSVQMRKALPPPPPGAVP